MKKNSMMIEQIFDIVCLIASYGILFLLPQKMDLDYPPFCSVSVSFAWGLHLIHRMTLGENYLPDYLMQCLEYC